MNDNPRITSLEMTTTDILVAMAGGNPGALTAMMDILQSGAEVDPDDALAPLGAIFGLDTLGVHDSHIWILYKDICQQNVLNMIGVLRAIQLGQISGASVLKAIAIEEDRGSHGLDVDEIVSGVKERLPRFGLPEAA